MKSTFIIVTAMLFNANIHAQTTVKPIVLKTEENGIQHHESQGVETKEEQVIIKSPEAKTISDYSIEDIDNILFGINAKLEYLQGSNEVELIKLLEAKKIELIERKKVLSNQN